MASHLEIDPRPAFGGWAPSDYFNCCPDCRREFIGDKRAARCADCAYGHPADAFALGGHGDGGGIPDDAPIPALRGVQSDWVVQTGQASAFSVKFEFSLDDPERIAMRWADLRTISPVLPEPSPAAFEAAAEIVRRRHDELVYEILGIDLATGRDKTVVAVGRYRPPGGFSPWGLINTIDCC